MLNFQSSRGEGLPKFNMCKQGGGAVQILGILWWCNNWMSLIKLLISITEIGTVRLFILDKISPLYVYFALYNYLFWTFFPNFFSKSKEVLNIWIHKNVRIKSNCALCYFKNQCFTHSNFWWCRRRIKNILLSKKRN